MLSCYNRLKRIGGIRMNIGFISLGCCKNLVDSENIMGLLTSAGCNIVNNPKKADVIMINTCGFIEPAKEEAINTILEMAEYKNGRCKKLLVLGCLAKRYKEQLIVEMPEVDRFIGIDEYPQLPSILKEELGLEVSSSYGKCERLLSTKPWMAYLKIAEGCSNRCAYCAIPLIRGPYVSYPMEDLIKEANRLAESGVKELVLIAQDTSRYGIDLYNELKLKDLLRELNKIEKLHWIRILYMYPDEIDDELLKAMKECSKVIPYFDIPVQHGEDEMLLAMNRRGSAESIKEICRKIRKMFDMPILRTTMIVGFPGETEKQFETMLDFVKEIEWDRLGAFTYSKEEDTPAYDLPDEIDEDIQNERYERLMALQQSIADKKSHALIGVTLEVLVENQDGLTGKYLGRSVHSAPDGIDGTVYFTSEQPLEFGSFVQVKIDNAKDHDCFGKAVFE